MNQKSKAKLMVLEPAIKVGGRLVGIGTDIVHLPRISKLLQKYPLSPSIGTKQVPFIKIAKKFMHPHEIANMKSLATECRGKTPSVTYIAGIWAIKESILKAFSSFVPVSEMPTAQCIYTRLVYKESRSSGQPTLRFDERFSSTASPSELLFYRKYIKRPATRPIVSISHDKDYLVSFVTLVDDGDKADGANDASSHIVDISSS